jgi:hypothetical protein
MLNMDDLKKKTCLVADFGKFISLAQTLSKEFGKVIYHNLAWRREFPKEIDKRLGDGVPGLTCTESFFDALKEADIVVFTDLYYADLAKHVRELGIPVWAMFDAEEYEIDRWKFCQWLAQNKMPMGEMRRVVGFDKLKELLDKEKDFYVKVSATRGDGETWQHIDSKNSAAHFIKFHQTLGLGAEDEEFVISKAVAKDGIELGYDMFTVDGAYPEYCEFGLEIKDEGYIGRICKNGELPEQLRYVNEKLSAIFKEHKSRSMFGTEVRIDKDGAPYFIDPALRNCWPPTEGLLCSFSNWGEIVWEGAHGRMAVPKPTTKYFALARLHSENAYEEWYTLEIPEKDREFVKLVDLTGLKGTLYVLPRRGQWDSIGSVVGVGDTPEKAIEDCKDRAGRLKGIGLYDTTEKLDGALKKIETAEKQLGIKF